LTPGPVLSLERLQLGNLAHACGTEPGSVLLSAFAAALLRLEGRDDMAIVAADRSGMPFPVRLAVIERWGFRRLAQAAERKMAAAAPHQRFAPVVLSGVCRMPGYLKVPPVFDLGYLEAASALDDGLLRFTAPAYRDLALILRLEDATALRLLFSPRVWAPDRIADMGAALLRILSAAAADPDVAVGDIPLAMTAPFAEISGRQLSALQFNF
jgi:hypothetical protein